MAYLANVWHTSRMSKPRQVPLEEAMQLLGISRSTVSRRLKDGSLTGHKMHGKWLIDLPIDTIASSESAGDSPPDPPDTVDELRLQLMQSTHQLTSLTNQFEQVEKERDFLRQRVMALEGLLHEQNIIMQTMQTQKALPAPGKRPWWKFWEREGEEPGRETT